LKFVDADVFLYAIIKSPKKDCEIAHAILKRIENGEATATSLAVVQEVVDFLEYNKRQEEIRPFLTAINSLLTMEKLAENWNDFLPAMDNKDNCLGFSFVDGLTLEIMNRHKITEIYSCDKDFDRVKGVKRVWE
jgi:predicted nucleic acid-binding protein